jgi:hypothetical protein
LGSHLGCTHCSNSFLGNLGTYLGLLTWLQLRAPILGSYLRLLLKALTLGSHLGCKQCSNMLLAQLEGLLPWAPTFGYLPESPTLSAHLVLLLWTPILAPNIAPIALGKPWWGPILGSHLVLPLRGPTLGSYFGLPSWLQTMLQHALGTTWAPTFG